MAPVINGRLPPSAAPHAPGAKEKEYWSSRLPGHRVLVWYSDDNVWHERVLLWPARTLTARPVRDRWQILTPDEHVYQEDLDQHHDVQMVVELDDGGARPVLSDQIYAFADPPDDEALLEWIRTGRMEGREDAAKNGGSVPTD